MAHQELHSDGLKDEAHLEHDYGRRGRPTDSQHNGIN
jgi:hypothetical protein